MKHFLKYLAFPALGCLLLTVPLLRDFHFESAMLAAVTGCFWAALKAASPANRKDFFSALRILGFLFLMGAPLFSYALATNCLTFDGFTFWLLIPIPSVFLGAAIGRLIRKLGISYPRIITLLILVLCAVGIWLYEFLTLPQVYFFNHVWGIWPGPIYDEAVQISGSLFYFRWLTFLWVVLLWMIPDWYRNRQSKLITGFTIIALMLSYLNLDEMGIINPRESIQEHLGGIHQTEHFTIYFDEDSYGTEEVMYWAKKHEFHFRQINRLLEIEWPQSRKIESYLYAHAWQKKAITGAKFTSYVPIWLQQDQLHIAKQQLSGVLKHELVHVISKQFGNSFFNGSRSIGLIEGLAEGIAKDASSKSTLHQIVAAEKPNPSAREMKSALSVFGFYGSAGAISYTTTGSFVEYLIDNYPSSYIKKSYAKGNFEEVFKISFDELIAGWHQELGSAKVDSVDKQISEFIFAQRSLFQKTCPHSISAEQQLWDDYQFHTAEEDTIAAHKKIKQLYGINPDNELVFTEWIKAELRQQNPEAVLKEFGNDDTLLTLQILKADAQMMAGNFEKADSVLQSIACKIEASTALNFRYSLQIRGDSLLWQHLLNQRYKQQLPDSAFQFLNYPNKILALEKALELENPQKVKRYSKHLLDENIEAHFFDIYEKQIDRLIFWKEFELSKKWLDKLSELQLRERYRERVTELNEWLIFMENQNV